MCFVNYDFWKTTSTFGCLHRNNNSYTGTSPRSRFLSSFKLTLGNEFPESVIHIDYSRYYYSYRIRMLFVFQQSIRYVSPIPARAAFNKKSPKSRNRSTKKSLKIKCKNKKKFLGEEKKKAARLESCSDDIVINIFEDGKEIDH